MQFFARFCVQAHLYWRYVLSLNPLVIEFGVESFVRVWKDLEYVTKCGILCHMHYSTYKF